MSSRKFNATVTTTALNGSTVELQDTMIFSGVDQKFVDFLTSSCKLAVGFLMRLLPSMGSYTLHYKTCLLYTSGRSWLFVLRHPTQERE